MPARSNRFQRLVALVKKHVADGAVVTESKMLADRITGASREVDVCVEASVGGHDVVVAIECTGSGRPADVGWVEEMKAKHERLPSHALVLASEAGFTAEAGRVAHAYGIETLSLIEVDEAAVCALFGDLKSLFLKLFDFHPARVVVRVAPTGTLPEESVIAVPDNSVFTSDGTCIGSMRELVDAWLNSESFIRSIGEQGDESHRGFTAGWRAPADRKGRSLCLQKEDPRTFRPIDLIEVHGGCHFKVAHFALRFAHLGRVRVVWSEAQVMDHAALLVASHNGTSIQRLTITSDGLRVGPSNQPLQLTVALGDRG